jgi:hypothetical protein
MLYECPECKCRIEEEEDGYTCRECLYKSGKNVHLVPVATPMNGMISRADYLEKELRDKIVDLRKQDSEYHISAADGISIALDRIREVQSKQRFELARELNYRKRLTTADNKIGKQPGFLTSAACAQKSYALQVVATAKMFGIITYQQERNFVSWITNWE